MMTNHRCRQLGGAPFKYFGDWTDRIAKGELPKQSRAAAGRRAQHRRHAPGTGDNDKQYLHDLIASDRRNPTVNAYGPLYGSPEHSDRHMPILDPKTNTATNFKCRCAIRMPLALGPGQRRARSSLQPSAYWGERTSGTARPTTTTRCSTEGPRLARGDGARPDNPAFCKKGSTIRRRRSFPLERAPPGAMYDPKTMKYTFVDTCFGTHHLQFGYDANDTLWTSGGGGGVGWLNTKMFDETGDAAKVAGLDAARARHQRQRQARRVHEPGQPVDPTKDKRIGRGLLRRDAEPGRRLDLGHVRGNPGAVVRIDPGENPPANALAEIYNVPLPGFGPRGGDIDKQGVVWVSLASGHMGSFDRRKCKGRSTARRRPAITAPKAGRSTSIPARASRASARTAPSRATTRGSTSTTRSARRERADVDRQPERRPRRAERTARWSRCACRIRSASTPRASTAASTIRTPAGRAAACGRRTATARRG
jgi:hypothetical protein